MAGKYSMELHQQLNESLTEGRRRSLHMWGLIRKIPSVNSMLLQNRDEAKEHLDKYVNKLSECLLDFRSEMMKELEGYLKKKQDELATLMKKYEDDVETLLMLCAETEKLVQFGKNLENPSDHEKAISLLQAFGIFLSRQAEEFCTKDLFHFDLRTTIQLDEIKPKIFGHVKLDTAEQKVKQEPQDDYHQIQDLTSIFKRAQCCMKEDDSGIALQDSSTQTMKLCGDVSIQTEDSEFSQINDSKKQEIDTSLLTGCNHHFSPPPGLPSYPVFPGCQNVSPISMINSPLPNVSPVLFYNQCLMAGEKFEQVDKDVSFGKSKKSKCHSDSITLSDKEHSQEKNTGPEQRKYPPGFSAEVLSSIHDANRSLLCSSYVADAPETLYPPPAAPKTAQDNNINFNDMGAKINCQLEKEPLIHPLNIKKEPVDNFQHSTPVKSSLSTKSSRELESDTVENNDLNMALLRSSWQNFIACPILSTESQHFKDERKFCKEPQAGSSDPENLSVNNSAEVAHLSRLRRNSTLSVLEKSLQALKEAEKDDAKSYSHLTPEKTSPCWDDDERQTDPEVDTTSHLDKNLSAFTGCLLDHDCDTRKNLSSSKVTNTSDLTPKDIVSKRVADSKDDGGVYVGDKNIYDKFEKVAEKSKEADPLTAEKGQKKTTNDDYTATMEKIGLSTVNRTALEKERQLSSLNQSKKRKASRSYGEQKENDSVSRRLGALQAHWLRTCHGSVTSTDLEAKFLSEISCDFHFPIGVSTNSEKHIIVTDTGNHVVKKLDQNGKLVCEFGKDLPMKRPSAVVVNDVDSMFIKDDVCIHAFDKDGHHIRDIGKSVFKKPFGLAMTPSRHLLVLETHSSNPSLIHLTQDGNKVWRYLYAPLVNAHPMSKCRFLGVSDNHVIVSDLGISQIYITTFDGIYLKKVGSFGNGIMHFREPSGISVDNYGNVVIGDSKNNRIQIYRYDGSYTGLLKMDEPIIRPSGVHLTSDNRLLVVNFLDNCIKVYQL